MPAKTIARAQAAVTVGLELTGARVQVDHKRTSLTQKNLACQTRMLYSFGWLINSRLHYRSLLSKKQLSWRLAKFSLVALTPALPLGRFGITIVLSSPFGTRRIL